jgi:hypothetical protein
MAQPEAGRRSRSAWLYAVPMWAGVSIVAIWLAVLFVGLFAGDIVTINGAAGAGTTSSVPSVVAVVPFAFIATVFLARWGFAPRRGERKGDGAS